MKRNHPIISTAKVRGMIKKNNLNYVDATRKWYPSIANGINVWQLCDSVYFRLYGETETIAKNLEKFTTILDVEGFAVVETSSYKTYEIVAKVGA